MAARITWTRWKRSSPAWLVAFGLLLSFAGCAGSRSVPAGPSAPPPPAAAALPVSDFRSPPELYGPLFVAVQTAPVFPDSKTFVDMIPLAPPAEIVARFQQQRNQPDFDLAAFVNLNFRAPPHVGADFHTGPDVAIGDHIRALWPVLSREPDEDVAPFSSLIPLPHPYVVPGGRFREIYYWDSYFTMLGLLEDGREHLFRDMVLNFDHLVQTLGFIPNGNRDYYLSRSQPPFFALMVGLWIDHFGASDARRFLPSLEREYAFWMDGRAQLAPDRSAAKHVVRLPDGAILNRYCDALSAPRPESYKEDVALAARARALDGRSEADVYRDIRSAAESGWDFSSRWFRDPRDFRTIHTTDIVPIDLNALLWRAEQVIATLHAAGGEDADEDKARRWRERANARREAINRHLWDPEQRVFRDLDRTSGRFTPVVSMAAVFPLFVGLADESQARGVAEYVKNHLLKPGGYVTTEFETGQQWDYPNGWPPLQWAAYRGFHDNGQTELAETGRRRWLALNRDVYGRTGKMLEKYNVVDLTLEAGGGEYPLQDGFGWTNGVFQALTAVEASAPKATAVGAEAVDPAATLAPSD